MQINLNELKRDIGVDPSKYKLTKEQQEQLKQLSHKMTKGSCMNASHDGKRLAEELENIARAATLEKK